MKITQIPQEETPPGDNIAPNPINVNNNTTILCKFDTYTPIMYNK